MEIVKSLDAALYDGGLKSIPPAINYFLTS